LTSFQHLLTRHLRGASNERRVSGDQKASTYLSELADVILRFQCIPSTQGVVSHIVERLEVIELSKYILLIPEE